MGELFTPTHLAIVVVVAIILFGGKMLPELGRGMGEGLRGFKDALKGLREGFDVDAQSSQSPRSTTEK